ncbi:MAG: hypothetical protein HOD17_02910, partial [Desulfobacteraceae bacterium]|nr:hypothetical protein [Desulfobacteraceae bacterium]
MAGDREIWNGFFKQTGAVKVETLQEMGEAAMVFQNLQSINGKRAVVLGAGGGSTVSNGDICTREGLEVPALSLETGEELSQFVSSVNQIITNPMDVPSMLTDPETFNRAFDLFMNDSTIDMVIISLPMPWMQGRWGGEILKNNIKNFIQERPNKKPIVVSVSDDWYSGEVEQSMREYREAGITTFRSLTMACRALRRFADYHKFKSS